LNRLERLRNSIAVSLVVYRCVLSTIASPARILGTKASQAAADSADTGGVGSCRPADMVALGIVLVCSSSSCRNRNEANKKSSRKREARSKSEGERGLAGGSLYIVRANPRPYCSGDFTGPIVPRRRSSDPMPETDLPDFQELVNKEIEGRFNPFAVVEANSSRR